MGATAKETVVFIFLMSPRLTNFLRKCFYQVPIKEHSTRVTGWNLPLWNAQEVGVDDLVELSLLALNSMILWIILDLLACNRISKASLWGKNSSRFTSGKQSSGSWKGKPDWSVLMVSGRTFSYLLAKILVRALLPTVGSDMGWYKIYKQLGNLLMRVKYIQWT